MAFEVKVVDNFIPDVRAELDNSIARALEACGLQMEANAKIEISSAVYDTPESKSGYVRTGNLRNSITHQTDATSAYVGSGVEYAPYVEMGTYKMDARPYIRPALENHIEEYKQIIENMLKL